MTVQRTAAKPEARVTATEANRHFSALLRRARAGETIAITDRGTVVARMVATEAAPEARPSAKANFRALLDKAEKETLRRGFADQGKFRRDWAYDD